MAIMYHVFCVKNTSTGMASELQSNRVVLSQYAAGDRRGTSPFKSGKTYSSRLHCMSNELYPFNRTIPGQR